MYAIAMTGRVVYHGLGTMVHCHYTGRLSGGTVFDTSLRSSSSKGSSSTISSGSRSNSSGASEPASACRPFSFHIGCGVIDGWSEGVATMLPGLVPVPIRGLLLSLLLLLLHQCD
jgi:hypothetical protein